MKYVRQFRVSGLDELEQSGAESILKIGMLLWIGCMAVGIWFIEWVNPNFFNFPYFTWNLEMATVWRFWPIFALGFFWAILFTGQNGRTRHDGAIALAESFGYVLTGLWEELMFRWALIPYTMIGLIVMNWIWSVGLGYVLGGCALIFGAYIILYDRKDDWTDWVFGCGVIAIGALLVWFGSWANPIFWFVGNILIPIANWATFGEMRHILIDSGTPLFIMGIFSANSAFRDGHKYQGTVGYVNSWYAGMVLIYATLTYGLLTAIAVHAIYDIIFAVTKYVKRKLFG